MSGARNAHGRWRPSSGWPRYALIAAAVILFGLYLLLPTLSRTAAFRMRVQRALASTGYDVALATMRIGYDLSIALGDVSVAAPQQQPFLRARYVEVPLSLWMLFRGRVASVRFDEPHLFVDYLPPYPADGGPAAFPFGNLQIVDGFAHYTTAQGEMVLGPLSLHIDSLAGGSTLTVRGRSEMALATLAQQLHLPGVLEGTVEATIQLSGSLRDLQGGGSLQARGLRWQNDGWVLSGDMELPFDLGSEKDGGGLRGTAKSVLANMEFHDAEHARAGEKIHLDGHVEVTAGPGAPKLRVDLRLAEGEILWRRFYADLKQHRTSLRGELRVVPEGMALRDVVLATDGIGNVTVSGSVQRSGKSALRARLDISGVNQLYALAVRDALKETHPFLGRTDVAGALRGDVMFRRSGRAWKITGDIRLRDGHGVATDPPLELRGMDIDLPIALGANAPGAAARTGSLRIAMLHLGGVQVPELRAALSVVPNSVRLATPLSVPVLGGTFVLNDLEASQLDGPQPQAHLGFALRDLDLGQLSLALGWPPLRGTMRGEIPDVQIANGDIRSDGDIRVQVFGGQAQVRNLRVRQIASSVPTLELDIDFQDILLANLTQTLEVGTISGVARGAIHDLALVHGEPLRFDAWMETVPRPGVAQRISVKAIGQISTLGGAGGNPLTQGMLSFFDEYRYAKMGFRCRLENDRFHLRGIEQSGGEDYLVVGSLLPPRVNVISHSQVISFSEMVRRLSRVTSERTSGAERSK